MRRRALLRLALAVLALSPLALVGWLSAEWSRWWLCRPRRLRRSLAAVGIALPGPLSATRIDKGRMNAVLVVYAGGEPRLVLKHMLRFGTLLGWAARSFGATREYPPRAGRTARTVRETRALLRLHRWGFATPRCLGFSVREHVIAMEHIAGRPLGPQLSARAEDLGAMLAAMHARRYSMGDANPENMIVDGAGRIVPFDFEQSHFAANDTQMGFDLAWAAAFLGSDGDRARFFAAYGERPRALMAATRSADAHLLGFAPIVEHYGQKWRRA
jgi:hypothetical protein